MTDEVYAADPLEVDSSKILAPPTFAACFTIGAGAVLSDPELGAHPNLVHGSQEFTFDRPIRAGDVLACTPSIVDIADRRRFDLLTYEIDCVDARSGDPVLRARSVIVFFNTEAQR